MDRRAICVVTGSRAEYGLLRATMRRLAADDRVRLQIVATGTHLSPEFGLTSREIEADGFRIDARVEMLLSSDSAVGVTKSTGLGVIGMGEAFERLRPDLVLLLGDRFEILAAAVAATIAGIPIAHVHGGEVTEGMMDDAIRHAITKMSQVHLTSAEMHSARVRQMGESPERVFTVGAPGIDAALEVPRVSRDDLETFLGIRLAAPLIVCTFHPVVSGDADPSAQLREVLGALESVEGSVIFTRPNADPGGRPLNALLDAFVARHPTRTVAVASLGQQRYFSALALADVVVGNSSSGLIEAPAFGIPTVNIGDRQRGRLRGDSVIDVPAHAGAVRAAIARALSPEHRALAAAASSPYGRGETAARMHDVLVSVDLDGLRIKRFHDA